MVECGHGCTCKDQLCLYKVPIFNGLNPSELEKLHQLSFIENMKKEKQLLWMVKKQKS